VLYPYNGYSGDRCMPGDWLPPALHAPLAAEVKAHLVASGHATPLAVAGKLSDPQDAERVVASGMADFVGIARGLLADPDWPVKVRRGEPDRIVRCDYCNVCKALDGSHGTVVCSLWPKGDIQAPAHDPGARAPGWSVPEGGLSAKLKDSRVELHWGKAEGASYYEVYRAEGSGAPQMMDALKVTLWRDHAALGGRSYRYFVRPYAASGMPGPRSGSVSLDVPAPDYLRG
jgi:NADH:flavin oxidoreductase/NADH oxidase family protein